MLSAETSKLTGMAEGAAPAETGQTSAQKPERTKRRRWPWVVAAGFAAIFATLAMAPQIVAWSELRHELPRLKLRGFKDEIRVGRASLSWWGPIELYDIELKAPDGKTFAAIGKSTEYRGVWDMLFHPDEPPRVRLDRPVITMLLRADGSNVRDAMEPVINHPKRRRDRSVEVVGGSLRVTNTTNGRSAEWHEIALKATPVPEGDAPCDLQLSAKLAGALQADPLKVECTWASDRHDPTKPIGPWEATVTTGNLPLAALSPILSRFVPDLDLAGNLTTRLHLKAGGPVATPGSRQVDADWELSTTDLSTTWPSRLGDAPLTLGTTIFKGKLELDGTACRVARLELVTGVCNLNGKGTIPLKILVADRDEENGKEPVAESQFALRGEVDLVGLARLSPQSLPWREGIDLSEGKITFDVTNKLHKGRSLWTGGIETKRLAAQIGKESVAWDEPLRFTFALAHEQGRIDIESLECQSEFVQVTGRGNSDGAHLEARCDLARLAARLGQFFKTESQEIRGVGWLVVDLKRDDEGYPVVDAKANIDDLLIRRFVTAMVDRRRGDIEQVNLETPDAAPPPRPRLLPPQRFVPPPGQILDKKSLKAMKKAEKSANREARREEKAAQEIADEIVRVPVTEWKTIWVEPKLSLAAGARFPDGMKRIELTKLEATGDGARLTAAGQLAEVFSHATIDLTGEAECDMARLVERLRDTVGPHLQLVGKQSRQFSIRGPLRNPVIVDSDTTSPLVPLEMKGKAGAGWDGGDLFGLQAGSADMNLALNDAIVTLHPLEVAVSGGKMHLAGQMLLKGGPPTIVVPAGPVFENVELTNEVCDTWLKYIAPVLSQATRADGRFSLALDESRFPVADLGSGAMSGRLSIAKGQVVPGPLLIEINTIIANIMSSINGNLPRDIIGVEKPLVVIAGQEIDFKLQDRRIYQTPMEFNVRNILVRTQGSVGLDQTLDLVAEIRFSDEVLSRAKFLSQFRDRPLAIPIRGTLKHPKVDPQAMAQFGQGTIGGIITQGIQKLIERKQQR